MVNVYECVSVAFEDIVVTDDVFFPENTTCRIFIGTWMAPLPEKPTPIPVGRMRGGSR